MFFDKIRDKIYVEDCIHLSVMDAGGNRISSTIASKLDFLMRLTNTQNNMLGKALPFDASYISRLRTGKRNLTRQRDVITPMAQYFARSARESYQRRVLAQRICPGEDWPASLAEGERLIAEWLRTGDDVDESDITDGIRDVRREGRAPQDTSHETTEFFYGNEGKREGVELFLSELCRQDISPVLLLHSDENMAWIYEDPEFARRWGELLLQIAAKGGKIKIVHTVRRSIEEMLVAIEKWMPLYMTGMFETYYCPRTRDNIYCRTLFVARKQTAFVSHSIVNAKKPMVNLLIRDKGAVAALEDEFFDYLALCRPLIRVYNSQNIEEFLSVFTKFLEAEDNMILFRSLPSRYTMPESVNRSMGNRTGKKGFEQQTRRLWTQRENQLAQGLQLQEILLLMNPDDIAAGKAVLPFCDLVGEPTIRYTVEEYAEHVEAMAELLEREPNYHVILRESSQGAITRPVEPSGSSLLKSDRSAFMLLVKESAGVVLHSAGPESMVFFSQEQDLTAAFWAYLSRLAAEEKREETMERLKTFARELRERFSAK